MKKTILRLLGYLHNFGPINGATLLLKTQLGEVNKVTLPNIRHPFTLRRNTSDVPTFEQVFINREYKINFRQPKVIFDCGANIGMFAIFTKNAFPDAQIICVEPDPENFRLLQKNLSVYDDVHCENCGVWNKDTKLKVYDKYNSGNWGMVVEEDLITGNIPAVSIKSLMDKYAVEYIDVLKIDIESSEKQLFADHYQDWLPRVKTIVIELHDFLVDGCSKTFFEAINSTFKNYSLEGKGENLIIINKDLA
jgi:FkbM family methyltransferase